MESKLIIAAGTNVNDVITDLSEFKNYINYENIVDKNNNCFRLNQIVIFDSEKSEVIFNDTITNRIKEGNKTEGNKYHKELTAIKFKPDVNVVRTLKLNKEKLQLIKAPQGEYWNEIRYNLYIPINLFSNPAITREVTEEIKKDKEQYLFTSDEFSLDAYVHTIEGTETVDRHKAYWNAKLEILKDEINNIDTLENLENYIESNKLYGPYVSDNKIKKFIQLGGAK